MSIGAVGVSNPVIAKPQNPAQNPSAPAAKTDQPTNASTATPTPSSPATTAASNVVAALKEATETAAQTAQEAGHGDRQAQRLVEKHQHHAAPAAVVNGSGQMTGEIINTKA
ncbi:hypothetical protein [Pseudomonas sp.]|jgi:hypothetical protein|uniref:hypothetical protein n=1 Tax=Pseudomonas sp. TaxID=306 RepID=UPI003D6F8345